MAAVMSGGERRRLDLTLTEFRILAHMARTPLRVFSRSEIMQACFDNQTVLDRTIDSHVSHLRRKLENADAAGLLTNVRGVGYRLEAEGLTVPRLTPPRNTRNRCPSGSPAMKLRPLPRSWGGVNMRAPRSHQSIWA